jgi:probable rRNA maturation factor
VVPGLLGPPLGDIVLAEETIRGEAEAGGLAFEDHLTHLIVHGFLHLVGHDHVVESEALVMEGLETAILGDLGIADPYAAAGAADER